MKRRINGAMMEAGGQTATALILNVWESRESALGRPAGRSWYGKSAVNARNIRKSRAFNLFIPQA